MTRSTGYILERFAAKLILKTILALTELICNYFWVNWELCRAEISLHALRQHTGLIETLKWAAYSSTFGSIIQNKINKKKKVAKRNRYLFNFYIIKYPNASRFRKSHIEVRISTWYYGCHKILLFLWMITII